MKIRKAVLEGSFYPFGKKAMTEMIDGLMKEAKEIKLKGKLKALIVPHAGWVYSGLTASYAFRLLKNLKNKPEKILLIGPSHQVAFNGIALTNDDFFETRFGKIELIKVDEKLFKNKNISLLPEAHEKEHDLEVELPFLQTILKEFKLLPITYGEIEPEKLAELIDSLIDEKTLLIVSSDLSHYLYYDAAKKIDNESIKAVLDLNGKEEIDACGREGIKALIILAKKNNWDVNLLDYRNSGDTAGDKINVVGYASFAFIAKS